MTKFFSWMLIAIASFTFVSAYAGDCGCSSSAVETEENQEQEVATGETEENQEQEVAAAE